MYQMINRMNRIGRVVASVLLMAFGLGVTTWPEPLVAQEAAPMQHQATILMIPMQRQADVSEAAQARLDEYLRALVEIDPKIKLVYLQEPTASTPPASSGESVAPAIQASSEQSNLPPDIEKATKLTAAGRESAQAGQFDRALTQLMKARGIFESRLSELENFDLYLDTLLWMSAAFISAGYREEGTPVLNMLTVMKPTLAIEGKDFSKRFVEAVDKAKGRATAGGDLTVDVSPPEARVFVDGRLLGSGKQTATGLSRGKHYVRVVADGFIPAGKQIATSAVDKPMRTQFLLRPRTTTKARTGRKAKPKAPAPEGTALISGARTGEFDADFVRDAKAAADKAMTDFLLVSYVGQTETAYKLGLFLFDVKTQTVFEIEPATFDRDLSSLQIGLLELEDRLSKAVTDLTTVKPVQDKPAIYSLVSSTMSGPVTIQKDKTVAVPTVSTQRATATGIVSSASTTSQATSEAVPTHTTAMEQPARAATSPSTSFEDRGSTSWYKKWWVWTLAGVALGGAGVGTYFLVKGQGKSSGFAGQAVW